MQLFIRLKNHIPRYRKKGCSLLTVYLKLVCLVVLVVMTSIGCQPTPDSDYVPQKDTTAMIDKAKGNAVSNESGVDINKIEESKISLRERYEIPDTYQCAVEFAEGRFILYVDASVEIQDSHQIPIVRVERSKINTDTCRSLFAALCGNTKMYYQQRGATSTKDQIASRLQYLMDEIADSSAYVKEYGEESLEQVNQEIQYLQSIYKDAPDNYEEIECHGDLVMVNKTDLSCSAISEDQSISFSAFVSESGESLEYSSVRYNNARRNHPEKVECIPVNHTYNSEVYSKDQATEDVADFLNQSKLSSFVIDSIQIPKDHNDQDPIYLVQCVRSVGNMKIAYSDSATFSKNPKEQYMRPWSYEHMDFWIDREGIFGFTWDSPIQVKETVVADAVILPFSQIMDIYLNMVNTKYAASMSIDEPDRKNGATLKSEYHIDRICLSLQRILEPNDTDSALLVPVWNFYGTNTRTDVEDYQEYTESRYLSSSMLSINAVDGSIIDPYKGY